MTLGGRFAARRIFWSRVIAALTLAVVLLVKPPASMPAWLAEAFELAGYALLIFAALWRVWCLVFIAGVKDGELVTSGPFSVVRNPLYVGTFAGLVGFGCAVELPALAIALGVLFALLYPAVVANEEQRLRELFGERFDQYCARVPRWVPDWSLYQEPAQVSVPPARMRAGILDAMWFLWAILFVELFDILRESGAYTPPF